MSDCAKVADVLASYSAALENLRMKVQQDRSVHCQELLNIYSESVASGSPREFVDKVSELITARIQQNDKKVRMDALEWNEHDIKTAGALGSDAGVLQGGARMLRSGKEKKHALHYCGNRCNAYHENLHKKLMHDRAHHAHELRSIHELAGGMMGHDAPMTRMVGGMVQQRLKYDSRKTLADAQHWAKLAKCVKGGGCKGMLKAGGTCHCA